MGLYVRIIVLKNSHVEEVQGLGESSANFIDWCSREGVCNYILLAYDVPNVSGGLSNVR